MLRRWISSRVLWGFIEDFILKGLTVGVELKKWIKTEDNNDSTYWQNEEGLEERDKSGMKLKFSGWGDEDVIDCNTEQRQCV